ncbi:MAG: rod shape-determining protein MreC [bacterium]|nr:rod shape-determining protein MreC [bacterium]
MGDLLRRFRYPLTYLMLCSLCVFGMSSQRGPAEFGIAPRLVLGITLPLERMVTLPVREVRAVWRDYLALVAVRQANERLLDRLARLEEENLQYREAILSSVRFQKLAGFRAQRDVPMVPANVVHQDHSSWFQSVIIDQGSVAGIRPGMPVITDSGVVGLVSGTTPSAAKVLLVVDPQSRVDAYVERSRARGSVRGGTDRACEFDYVLRDDDVQEGDLLLTSGLGAVYPKGLAVGYISEVEHKRFGLFQVARLKPAVDFSRLEEVYVILEQRTLPPSEAFSSDDPGLWPKESKLPEGNG